MTVVNIERIADTEGLRPQTRAVMFGTGFTITSVQGVIEGGPEAAGSVTDYERVDADGGASVEGEDIAPATVTTTGDVTVGGALILGPGAAILKSSDVTTIGNSAAPLLAIPSPDNRGVSLIVSLNGNGSAGFLSGGSMGTALIISGSVTPLGFNPISHSLGLPPSVTLSWSTNVLTLSAVGPQDVVASTLDNGSGKLQIIVSSQNLSPQLTGLSVTISGLTGTPGGNGAHVATYVGTDSFDLTSVAYVAPDSAGTIVLTTSITLTWGAVGIAVIVG